MSKRITAAAVLTMVVLGGLVLGGCSGGGAASSKGASGAQGRATSQSTAGSTAAPSTGNAKATDKPGAKAGSDASPGTDASASSGKGKSTAGPTSQPGTGTAKKPAGTTATGTLKKQKQGTAAGKNVQSGSNASPGSDTGEPGSGAADAKGSPAQKITNKAEAAQRYQAIDDAYTASLRDLLRALATKPLNMKVVRAGVVKSTGGYQTRLDSLRAVEWPSAVQPKVDLFVELASTTGHRMFKEMEKAQTPADLSGRADEPDVRKLRSAEMGVRSALGLRNPSTG
jgi:hypothetical protein